MATTDNKPSSQFKNFPVRFDPNDYPDGGIKVSDLINILEGHDLQTEIFEILKIDEIINDFIEIPGAYHLVNKVMSVENRYVKFDLDSEFKFIDFSPSGASAPDDFEFSAIIDEEVLSITEDDRIFATPIRSAQREFFSHLYNMDRYVSKLTQRNLYAIVRENIRLLKDHGVDIKKRFRMLKDEEGKFYFRAITSEQYRNYDNKMALVMGLVMLHKESKKSGMGFMVQSADFSESTIQFFLRQTEHKKVDGLGKVMYTVIVSNNELAQGALKFNGSLTIDFSKDNEDPAVVYVTPERSEKHKIISISHAWGKAKTLQTLKEFDKYKEKEEVVFMDLEKINRIKDPDQIRHQLLEIINGSSKAEIRKYKTVLQGELSHRIDSMYKLMKLLNKLDLISEDIEAREFLRYKAYDLLTRTRR